MKKLYRAIQYNAETENITKDFEKIGDAYEFYHNIVMGDDTVAKELISITVDTLAYQKEEED